MSKYKSAAFEDLKGKILSKITGNVGDYTMIFYCSDGEKYQLRYYPDCCASCRIEDICGDLQDILHSPIVVAEEVSSHENPGDIKPEGHQDSFTWTFYKLDTIKGGVTIRWYGESNGYYSEAATFEKWVE